MSARPPSGFTFYLDESIYSRQLEQAMLAAGMHVETPRSTGLVGEPDEVWLAKAGANQWIALMRDQKVRYRDTERAALKDANVGAFVFTGGQATAKDTAAVIVRLLPAITRIYSTEKRPFLYTFGQSGRLGRSSI